MAEAIWEMESEDEEAMQNERVEKTSIACITTSGRGNGRDRIPSTAPNPRTEEKITDNNRDRREAAKKMHLTQRLMRQNEYRQHGWG